MVLEPVEELGNNLSEGHYSILLLVPDEIRLVPPYIFRQVTHKREVNSHGRN